MLHNLLKSFKCCVNSKTDTKSQEVDVEDLKEKILETNPNTKDSNTQLNDKAKNYFNHGERRQEKQETDKIFNLMNPYNLNQEEEEINHNTIKNSPKFGEKIVSHQNSMNSTEKNCSIRSGFLSELSHSSSDKFFFRNGLFTNSVKATDLSNSAKTNDRSKEDLIQKVFCMNNIVILDMEIKQAKKLVLEDVEGHLLKKQILVIDASGLNNSLRKMRDGHTFFGPMADYKNWIINDFIIEGLKNEGNIQRLFVIYFERNSQKYFLRPVNENNIENSALIYTKIIKPFKIKTKQYISLLEAVFYVSIFDLNLNVVILNDKAKDKNPNEKLTYNFHPDDSPITIGRGDCKIKLNYSSLSKKHCTIYYNQDGNNWEIYDGSEGRNSTNGTWLTINSKYEIEEETFVKIGHNTFKISFE